MKKINIDTWDRKEHYLFFKNAYYGHYHIGCDLDITNFKRKTKEQGLAFSFAMTYAVTVVMNQVEAFRYRNVNDKIILYDMIHPSFTYVAPDMKYFKFVTTNIDGTIEEFVQKARDKALSQKEYFPMDEERRSDVIYISSIPKVSFTHLSHTMSFNKGDTTPRLSWGKFYERDGRIMLPFNVQAHHAFIDGNHMGDYIEALQEYFDNY
ncbi:MAG: CatA-like O-acetyltransferase [Coprobacillaceae bacterium]